MPKEVIYPSYPVEKGAELRTVQVGWEAERDVELFIGVDRGETGERWSVELDRQQINKLIRVLRRSRDQAYGRDE